MSYHKFSNFGEKLNCDLNAKVNAGLEDVSEWNLDCVCQKRCKKGNGDCAYGGNCRQQMVVYNLHCKCCGKDYVGKTQNHLRKRTDTHYYEAWLGMKGHFKDSFARHVAGHCKELTSSNAVTRWCRENIEPSIIYQGERLKCMKSAKTMNCKMCMVERKEILQRMKTNKHKLINDNSDIFARCSCKCRFHKFFRTDSTTLRTRLTQKKVTSTRHSKLPRVRRIFTFSNSDDSSTSSTEFCSPCNSEAPTPASSEDAGVFLFNNVPGLPPRSPTAIPMPNLELAQVQHHYKYNYLSVEV